MALNAGIRSKPGNKFKPNGYIIDNPKLINVSFINIFCVLLKTIQKQEIKYQQNNNIKILKMKKIKNLILIYFFILFDFNVAFFNVFCFLILNISFSDKENSFNNVFITEETSVEYNI